MKKFLFCALAALAPLSEASADELLTLKPGVTERGAKPETWQLDLTNANRQQAQAAAQKLSTRLYGRGEKELHSPLLIKTNAAQPRVFGFQVAAVSVAGATLQVKRNNELVFRKTWPTASATHQVNTLFHFAVPPGPAEIALEVPSLGVVVMDSYHLADTLAQLPPDVKKSEATVEEGEVTVRNPPAGMKLDVPAYKTKPDDGYRGIWFTLGQMSEHGDKYSGGLGTYTANHVPMAVYAPQVDKTFFTYGGTVKGKKHLLIMASYYDHKTGQVPRPVIVHDKNGVDDPHDNGSINIDENGHILIYISGRGRARPGFKYRSVKPFDISNFELLSVEEMTYPQPHIVAGQGILHLFTKYTKGRELYFETSADGKTWSEDQKLAGLGGHYQVSSALGNKIGTFFNYHPDGNVDRRTNLYYVQTTDMGRTWTTVDGKPLTLPLSAVKNPALLIDYEAQKTLQYTCDLNWDKNGNPILLYVTSKGPHPGPQNDPREVVVTRWNGTQWITSTITKTDHNYDMGSLYVDGDLWRVILPTLPGPQIYGGGGEMCLWTSRDEGKTWTMKQITQNSAINHNYARRPLRAKDPFFSFWADGDPTKLSQSRLYFSDSTGEKIFQLPYDMQGEFATPIEVKK